MIPNHNAWYGLSMNVKGVELTFEHNPLTHRLPQNNHEANKSINLPVMYTCLLELRHYFQYFSSVHIFLSHVE